MEMDRPSYTNYNYYDHDDRNISGLRRLSAILEISSFTMPGFGPGLPYKPQTDAASCFSTIFIGD